MIELIFLSVLKAFYCPTFLALEEYDFCVCLQNFVKELIYTKAKVIWKIKDKIEFTFTYFLS